MQILKAPERRFRHPEHRWSMTAPPGWREEVLAEPTRPWIALAPSDDFAASLVVTTDAAPTGGDLAVWQDEIEAAYMSGLLAHYQPIDLYFANLPAGRAYVRVAHYANDEGRSLTLRQWCLIKDGVGYTITGTYLTLQPEMVDIVQDAVATFAPNGC